MRFFKVLAGAWFVITGTYYGFVLEEHVKSIVHPDSYTLNTFNTYKTTTKADDTHKKASELLELVPPPEVPAPNNHPPLRIVVGADVFTVHYTTEKALVARDAGAFCDLDNKKIWLDKAEYIKNARTTVLHELLHASLYESRGGAPEWSLVEPYSSDENSFVTPMAPELLQILQDNPNLVKWLNIR